MKVCIFLNPKNSLLLNFRARKILLILQSPPPHNKDGPMRSQVKHLKLASLISQGRGHPIVSVANLGPWGLAGPMVIT